MLGGLSMRLPSSTQLRLAQPPITRRNFVPLAASAAAAVRRSRSHASRSRRQEQLLKDAPFVYCQPSHGEMLAAVNHSTSLVHLQVVLSQYGHKFSPDHWEAAVNRLPDLVFSAMDIQTDAQVKQVMHQFESTSGSYLSSYSANQLVELLSTCAQLQYMPSISWLDKAMDSLLKADRTGVVASCNCSHLCSLVSALAKLRYADVQGWVAILSTAKHHVKAMSPEQLAHLAVGFAATRVEDPVLLQLLGGNVIARLPSCSATVLSCIAAAFATMQHVDPKFWTALSNASLGKLRDFLPDELTRLLKSMAEVGFYSKKLFNATSRMVLDELKGSPWTACETFRSYDLAHLSDLLFAYTRLGIQNVPFFTAIARYVACKAHNINPASLQNPDLRHWLVILRKQQDDYFLYGFFLSLAFGVLLDQMLAASVCFLSAWWMILRPMITDAAASAYARALAYPRKNGRWGAWFFSLEDPFQAFGSSTR